MCLLPVVTDMVSYGRGEAFRTNPKGSRVRENKRPFFTPISQMIPREVLESPRILPQDALLVTVANTMRRCFIQFVVAKGWSKSQFQPIPIFYLEI